MEGVERDGAAFSCGPPFNRLKVAILHHAIQHRATAGLGNTAYFQGV
jgi:hypothetical protein